MSVVNKIILNDTAIRLESYKEAQEDGLIKVWIEFKVTSEDYHDITSLLYKGKFDVNVPEKGLSFKGEIQEYATSITNLYEKGQVGDFRLCLRQTEDERNMTK